jgi:flagellar biosynthesis anti-sigma factor FlgM
MQINDNLPIIPKPTKESGKTDGVQKSTTSPVIDPKASLVTATPAASIDVSVSAKLTEMQVKKDTTPVTDKVLLDKIKAKIASGTFEIDYQQISQAMLHESLAAIGVKSN